MKKLISRPVKLFLIGIVLTGIVFFISIFLLMNSQTRNDIYLNNSALTSINYGGIVIQESPRLKVPEKDSVVYQNNEITYETAVGLLKNTYLKSSEIDVSIKVDYAKRALVLEPSYATKFYGKYVLINDSDKKAILNFEFPFPSSELEKEITNATLVVNGKKIENAKRTKSIVNKIASQEVLFENSLYWEGDVDAGRETVIEVHYNTVGLYKFKYSGFESDKRSSDFKFKAKIYGSRDYDNLGSLSIDKRNYFSEEVDGKKVNGVELIWEKPDLFSKPNVEFAVATRTNPAEQLSSIYKLMTLIFIAFIVSVTVMAIVLKVKFGGLDMVIVSALFTVFFPFLHYLTSFTIEPSVEILSGIQSPISYSMPLYLAFAVALILIGGLIFYMVAKISGIKFAAGIVLPSIIVYMGFFPFALTIPEYKGILTLIGIILILFVIVQLRISGKLTKKETEK